MKLKIIFGILVVVALVLGGVFFFKESGKEYVANQNPDTALVKSESPIIGGEKISGSMKDLTLRGDSLRCVFNQDTQFAKTLGYVYVADGKVRGDFTVTPSVAEAKPFTASMIADSEISYVWSSVLEEGFKIQTKTELEPKPKDVVDGVDFSQNLNLTCEKWNKDFSAFTPPTSVTFVEK